MGEAFAQMAGIYHGFGDALRLGGRDVAHRHSWDAMSKLDPRFNAISAEAFQLSGPVGRAVDLLGTVVRVPGRALVARTLLQGGRQPHGADGPGDTGTASSCWKQACRCGKPTTGGGDAATPPDNG